MQKALRTPKNICLGFFSLFPFALSIHFLFFRVFSFEIISQTHTCNAHDTYAFYSATCFSSAYLFEFAVRSHSLVLRSPFTACSYCERACACVCVAVYHSLLSYTIPLAHPLPMSWYYVWHFCGPFHSECVDSAETGFYKTINVKIIITVKGTSYVFA